MLVIFIIILCLPVLIYVPFIQDFMAKVATDVVYDSTGMKIGIGKFRLGFPLDVQLDDVYVVEAKGDTMVKARQAIADVKLLPLLKLDVQLNRLQLYDGYYRMMAADSSLLLTVNAGFLEVDDKSSANISTSQILLNKTLLRDGRLSLYMDVWKKQETPVDSTQSSSPPFVIKANDLQLENFSFGMSMLPTIDTMDVALKRVEIKNALVDLGENLVKWKLASIGGGNFTYLTPTPEYIKTHPAPPSQPSTGPPMRIMGDSIAVDSLSALYAVRDAKPMPGFDASYLKLDGIEIGMKDFYNESSTVKLPLTRLRARERCGLQITSGSGTVGIDSLGLTLDKMVIRTPFTALDATADVPFEFMAMSPKAEMSVKANGHVGIPDVDAFMPSLKATTAMLPGRVPLDFNIEASGSLADIIIDRLDVAMAGVLGLKASGFARNPLDYKKMVAKLKFDGSLSSPEVADRFIGINDFKLPAFKIKGDASANGMAYAADFDLISDAGDLAAKGNVAITPETYSANIRAVNIDVARFVPDLGIGKVTADVHANGRGFNPVSGNAVTDAIVDISHIQYNKKDLRNIHINALLKSDGALSLAASSANPGLDFVVDGSGSIHPDNYTFDINALLNDVDLREYGFTDSICSGSADISIKGSAQPSKWIYDVDIDARQLNWAMNDMDITLPAGVNASLKADPIATFLTVNSLQTKLDFNADSGLEALIKAFSETGTLVAKQINDKSLDMTSISEKLPEFKLKIDASGHGLVDQVLTPSGISLDTITAMIYKDSLIKGNVDVWSLNTGSMTLDTITLNLAQRGKLLDYKIHLGNRPGTLDEFAKVNLNGYLGDNRVSAYLNQWNITGEQGYRIGLTAALMDSVLTTHITPLKSTIAYLPWTFNSDNFIDVNLHSKHIEANLNAMSAESSILAKTVPLENGNEELNVKIDNLHIEDFLRMWAGAPGMTGDLNADMHILYADRRFSGKGSVGLQNFVYEKTRLGNFDLDLDAGYGLDASTDVNAALKINGYPALAAYANLRSGDEGMKPDSLGVSLTRFPLKIANPFLGDAMALDGYLNGDMRMDGSFSAPRLNGAIAFDSVVAHIPMLDARLRFGEDLLSVTDNLIKFENFDIFAANENPLTIQGSVDARKFSSIVFDLAAQANNFQLIKTDKRSKGDIFGKIFLNLNATITGPMNLMNINGNVNILSNTEATYRMSTSAEQITASNSDGIVKFVNFNDTTAIAQKDTVVESPLNMRVDARLAITSGAQFEVLLSGNGTDKVELAPTANLHYYQNYMGDMSLNGTLTLGEGFARYAVPVIGEKTFKFNPSSTITWNGNVLDPILNVSATDEVKANVTSGNSSRLINFLVTLNATNSLDNLKVMFDLSTNDDLAIQNELSSMSADQRQTQAMNLLLYGQYTGANTKAKAASSNLLYGYLESTLNSWAAKHIRAVDLSFGVNQYDKTTDGVSSTETSYSYQLSKSLFNNRFKIMVGGNYSTDAADDEIAQNLVSDVSFEYILKQTQNMNMAVRLFRHSGYESILEGEITEMGGGFVMKRRLSTLRGLFRFGKRRRKDADKDMIATKPATMTDSVATPSDSSVNIPSLEPPK
ncbi:MAG: translocation/assembly module TamB [Muribaculaceae bacterium]|nr:translocation/assembly module TamB [Muribaculaceae bacterium]